MKRVEVNMSQELRSEVSDFASENELTMPQAYAYLMQEGLIELGVIDDKVQEIET